MNENIQRELEITPKGARGSSQTSQVSSNDDGEDTAPKWDQTSEDLDADFNRVLLNSHFEQVQEKAARVEVDDDSISLT